MAIDNLATLNTDIFCGFSVVEIRIIILFKECKPKILVVTDILNFTASDFGLSDFVNTLKTSKIHGMKPIVETALHQRSGTADHPDFYFTLTSLSKSKYDVLFIFGSSSPSLNPTEVGVIRDFRVPVVAFLQQAVTQGSTRHCVVILSAYNRYVVGMVLLQVHPNVFPPMTQVRIMCLILMINRILSHKKYILLTQVHLAVQSLTRYCNTNKKHH